MSRKSRLRYKSGRDIVKKPIASRRLPRITVRTTKQLKLDYGRIFGHDNRAFSPIPKALRPARTVSGRISYERIQVKKPLSRARYEFSVPRQTMICVRRGVRREVIFASGKGGKNGLRKMRRNSYSNISC